MHSKPTNNSKNNKDNHQNKELSPGDNQLIKNILKNRAKIYKSIITKNSLYTGNADKISMRRSRSGFEPQFNKAEEYLEKYLHHSEYKILINIKEILKYRTTLSF